MTTLDHIRESIDARIAELTQEITLLESARAALHGTRTRGTQATASGKETGKRRPRRTSSAAVNALTAGADGQTDRGATGPTGPTGPTGATGATRRTGATGEPAAAGGELPSSAVDQSPQPRRRSSPRGSKGKTPAQVLLAGELEKMLGETKDGLSAIAISRRASAAYDQVLELLRHLESVGQVRRTGSRRTSLWQLITDEERIAARAAELEARSANSAGAG